MKLFAIYPPLLLLLALVTIAAGQVRYPLPYPPQLPGGAKMATDRAPEFLNATADLHAGVEIARTPPKVDFHYLPGAGLRGQSMVLSRGRLCGRRQVLFGVVRSPGAPRHGQTFSVRLGNEKISTAGRHVKISSRGRADSAHDEIYARRSANSHRHRQRRLVVLRHHARLDTSHQRRQRLSRRLGAADPSANRQVRSRLCISRFQTLHPRRRAGSPANDFLWRPPRRATTA